MAAIIYKIITPPKEFPDRLAILNESETVLDNDYYNLPQWAVQFRYRNGTGLGSLFLLNQARVPYFAEVWRREVGQDGDFLDVGCGGGVATNALAEMGFKISGVDLAENALEEARREAKAMNIKVPRYDVGSVYNLPYKNESVDGVLMSDVMEHFHDLRKAASEVFRILKPGGVLVLDTINRNRFSWIGLILVAEILTGFIPKGTHDWRMFITPDEMETLLTDAGFRLGPKSDLVGFGPDNPFSLRPTFILTGSDDLSGSYLWWAQKPK